MRHLILTLALLVAAAGLTGAAIYRFSCDRATAAAVRDGDALRWLRTEFQLSDTQYAAILREHEDHSARCGKHCAAVMAARKTWRQRRRIRRMRPQCRRPKLRCSASRRSAGTPSRRTCVASRP